MSFTPSKPHYRLKVKREGRTAIVGAGWLSDKGNISIKLDVCTVLSGNDDLTLTLFPEARPDEEEG